MASDFCQFLFINNSLHWWDLYSISRWDWTEESIYGNAKMYRNENKDNKGKITCVAETIHLRSKNYYWFFKKSWWTDSGRNFNAHTLFRKIRVKNDYYYLSCLDMLLYKWKMILMQKLSQSNFIKSISRDTIMSGKCIFNHSKSLSP